MWPHLEQKHSEIKVTGFNLNLLTVNCLGSTLVFFIFIFLNLRPLEHKEVKEYKVHETRIMAIVAVVSLIWLGTAVGTQESRDSSMANETKKTTAKQTATQHPHKRSVLAW